MKKIVSLFIIVSLFTLSLYGCNKEPKSSSQNITSSVSSMDTESSTNSVPESYMITSKNYFDYQPGLECSAFASAYLLRHFGEEADGLKLYENFPGRLPGGGAMPSGIETFFNGRGYQAAYKTNGTIETIKKLVSSGTPVIVFIHIEEPYQTTHNTHYIPLIGYDKDNFFFAESLSDFANCKEEKNVPYNRKTEIAKFERLWKNIDGMWENPYFEITKK